ncbi:MAG: preprotein translocase subunit SecG [Bacteroidetes bacterium]|jgi:preprotein translocase subunit SecG|nr:preprotein translocase subunit SecG [Bacteroidota bacterium]
MDFILSALTILASILLILVVYVQNSKGGGLSSDFGAANQLGGVQKTTEFIEKLTWSLAGVIVVASILTTIRQEKPVVEEPAKQEQQKGGAPQGGQQQQQQQPAK